MERRFFWFLGVFLCLFLGNFVSVTDSWASNYFDPCVREGETWENQDQPGMRVSFYRYFDQCKYELFIQSEVIDTGTVQINGDNWQMISDEGRGTTEAQVIDECHFRWGQAGTFYNSECGAGGGGSGGGGSGGGGSLPPSECSPISYMEPGYAGGAFEINGRICGMNLDGTIFYQNYTLSDPSLGLIMAISGQVNFYLQSIPPETPQIYVIGFNGGPLYYQIGRQYVEVYFENVEFITDLNLYPMEASGIAYINGTPYEITPDLFNYLF